MKPSYTVILYTPQELNHSSYVQTGLFELERLGIIRVKVKLCIAERRGRIKTDAKGNSIRAHQAYPKASYYRLVDHNNNKSIFFCMDLYDFGNQFPEHALQHCDYVFKRHYDSRYVKFLERQDRDKLLPLGLSFGVHSHYKTNDLIFKIGLFLSHLRLQFILNRSLLKRLQFSFYQQQKHLRFIQTTRTLDRFESYTLPSERIILFQTRCFLNDHSEDVKAIHEQRYRLIRLLRQEFPDQFQGGFVRSPFSEAHYADALTHVPSDPERYLDVLKQARIVIYTRGLANSPAWKMAEYLSQGKVILAEPLSAELPIPLTHGKEVLFFNTDEELVTLIHQVLNDDDLALRLSQHARAYFEAHVHPVPTIKRILELMVTPKTN